MGKRRKKEPIPDPLILEVLDSCSLRPHFKRHFGNEPSTGASQSFMKGNLMYLQQVKREGGLTDKVRHQLRNLAKPRLTLDNFRAYEYYSLTPGTRLIKYWKLEWHEVLVVENGFIYRDAEYKTLEQVARLINPLCKSTIAFFKLDERHKL